MMGWLQQHLDHLVEQEEEEGRRRPVQQRQGDGAMEGDSREEGREGTGTGEVFQLHCACIVCTIHLVQLDDWKCTAVCENDGYSE